MSALSAASRREYYVALGHSLPPPVIVTSATCESRLIAAVETFEALRPGDAYEAQLAVKIVLCGAHAVESMRLAGVYQEDFAKMTRCRAQASSMLRAEASAKRTLAQEQKLRLAEASVADSASAPPVAAAPSPSAEPSAAPPQVQAASAAPPQVQAAPAAPQAGPVPTPAAPLRPTTARAPAPPVPVGSAPPPSPEAIDKAEAFVQYHGVAAARIRRDGGVTPQNRAYFSHVTFPTDPAVIDALVHGSSDLLIVLDEIAREALDAAA